MEFRYVTIRVNRLEDSVGYFTRVLEFKETHRITPRPGMTIVFMDGKGQTGIELIEIPGFEGAHDALSLTFDVDDMDAALTRFESLGETPQQGPMPIGEGGKMCLFEDPSGIQIGLIWQP